MSMRLGQKNTMKLGITKLNKELAMKKTIALLACAFTVTGVSAKLPAPTPEQAAAAGRQDSADAGQVRHQGGLGGGLWGTLAFGGFGFGGVEAGRAVGALHPPARFLIGLFEDCCPSSFQSKRKQNNSRTAAKLQPN